LSTLGRGCKAPFAGPEQVLRYLSRYTHRVAISNRRLVAADDGAIAFRWKDYRVSGPRQNPHSARGTLCPHYVPRLRTLALFGRRPANPAERLVIPASKNLHTTGH
jgi:hypothetical protein